MLTSQQFFQHLRSTLNHLYDPYFLRKSPLVSLFQLGDQPDTPNTLQRILNEAIEKLEPRPGDASYAQRRRNYELIMYRYVQQFNQEEVANQLGLSVRHLRREQNAAIFDLAARLWEQYHLGSKPFQISLQELDEAFSTAEAAGPEAAPAEDGAAPQPSDLSWLEPTVLEPTDLKEVLADVLELSQPLASRYGVTFERQIPADLALALIPQVALRQLLLNMLSVAVRWHNGGSLGIQVSLDTGIHLLLARPGESGAARSLNGDEKSSLDLAAQIARVYGGTLRCALENGLLSLALDLPVARKQLILTIDDNLDFLQLIERYLTGPYYTCASERNPRQAIAAVEQYHPDLVLLDVMMPGVDGWEVLGRLRRHPASATLPILVCSIVPQEELALSLGAAAFIRKPVSQETLLAALSRLLAHSSPPSPPSAPVS